MCNTLQYQKIGYSLTHLTCFKYKLFVEVSCIVIIRLNITQAPLFGQAPC